MYFAKRLHTSIENKVHVDKVKTGTFMTSV